MQKGFSSADGLTDRGDPAEGALRKGPDLPAGPRQCGGAPETTGTQQEGVNETPAGDAWEHTGQLGQRKNYVMSKSDDVDGNKYQFWLLKWKRVRKICLSLWLDIIL